HGGTEKVRSLLKAEGESRTTSRAYTREFNGRSRISSRYCCRRGTGENQAHKLSGAICFSNEGKAKAPVGRSVRSDQLWSEPYQACSGRGFSAASCSYEAGRVRVHPAGTSDAPYRRRADPALAGHVRRFQGRDGQWSPAYQRNQGR